MDFDAEYIIYEILCVISLIYYVFVTKKIFFKRLSIIKGFLLVLVSPLCSLLLASSFGDLIFGFFATEDGQPELLFVVFFLFGVQLIFQIITLFLYLKIVKAVNPSIAVFIYVCNILLLPNVTLFILTDAVWILVLVDIALMVLFYFLTVKPMSVIAGKKLKTNILLFILLPVVAYLFSALVLGLVSIVIDEPDVVIDMFVNVMSTLADKGIPVMGDMLGIREYLHFNSLSLGFLAYSSITVILLILMISFHVITKNIIFMNEAEKANKEIKTLSVEVMEALAHTIDAKDAYTRGHSVRVAKYSRMIAEKMGLSETECENVYYYGLLHDIGKIAVPNEIINSPGPLTDEDYSTIKIHPGVGYDILDEIKSRPDLGTGARWHHERYDGKGYPDGRSGEDIPLLARIIAVADSYDAMTSNRSYRNYLPQDKVRSELDRNSGSQFDPKIAKCMIEIIDEDKEYTLHE